MARIAVAAVATLAGIAVILAVILVTRGDPADQVSFEPAPAQSAAPTAAPSATAPSPTASPEATPTPVLTPEPPLFQNDALATIRVNDLNVRGGPSRSSPALTDAEGRRVQLATGEHVIVLSGAVWADETWWFMVAVDDDLPLTEMLVGWAAGGTRAEPWISEEVGFCPGQEVSFLDLLGMTGVERVGCFAQAPITIEAYQAVMSPDAGLGGACQPPPGVPDWLACDNINDNWVNRDGGTAWEFLLHFDPARDIEPTGLAPEGSAPNRLRITGHFDDPAAAECITSEFGTEAAASERLTCASRFVVESVEPVEG